MSNYPPVLDKRFCKIAPNFMIYLFAKWYHVIHNSALFSLSMHNFDFAELLILLYLVVWQSPDDLKSMSVEAVLLLQGKINDEDDDTVIMRLLVPSKVIGCIIGKSGSIINEIRKRTKVDVRISKGEKPNCADINDELVEVLLDELDFCGLLLFSCGLLFSF